LKFRRFDDARAFAKTLGLKGQVEWHTFSKSGGRPQDIPSSPDKFYKDDWKGWGDWLGTGIVANSGRSFRAFEEAREIVRREGLSSGKDYRFYCRSGKKPKDIPTNPPRTYKQKWKGWGDFLGTGRIADQNKQYQSFVEAKNFVRTLALKSEDEWRHYCKSGLKPEDIPARPDNTYRDLWKGMGDLLGTNFVAFRNRRYQSFEEAKKLVHTLHLISVKEWQKYCNSGRKPENIAADPASFTKVTGKAGGIG